MEISAVTDGKDVIEELQERITGRFACEDIYSDDGELIVKSKPYDYTKACSTCMPA